jgi:hypothetical protein
MPNYLSSLPAYPEQAGNQSEAQDSYSTLANFLLVAKCVLAIFVLVGWFSSGSVIPTGRKRARKRNLEPPNPSGQP